MYFTKNNHVVVHVYDLAKELNDKFYKFGLGIFHSGVEINGKEYWFFGHQFEFTGIIVLNPGIRSLGSMTKRESIFMGISKLSSEEIQTVINDFSYKYKGNTYHPLNRNCNHFSNDFCQTLVGKRIPSFINRIAYIGTWIFYCIKEEYIWWILQKILGDEPETQTEEQTNTTRVDSNSHLEKEDTPLVKPRDTVNNQKADATSEVQIPAINVNFQETQHHNDVQEQLFESLASETASADAAHKRDVATHFFLTVNSGSISFEQTNL